MSNKVVMKQFLNKANASIKSNNFNDARYYFDKVLAIDSFNEEAIVGKAFCLYQLGDGDFAYKLCMMVSKNNLKDDSLKYYDSIMKNYIDDSYFDNNNLNELFKKAYDSIILEDFNSANFYFNHILKLDYHNHDAKIGRSYCYYYSSNISHARKLISFVNYNKLSPISIMYYNEIRGENLKIPLKRFNSIKIEGLYKKAAYFFNIMEYNKAIKYLNKILNLDNDADAIVCKAYCYYKLKNYVKAYDLLEKINKTMLNVDYFKYYDELIIFDKNNSSFNERINNENYLKEDSDVISLINDGFNNLSQGNPNIAKTYFDKALKLDSGNDDALVGKSFCYYEFENDFHAKELLNNVIEENLSKRGYNYYIILLEKYGILSEGNSVVSNTKICPSCGKEILKDSIWCIYCNHYFKEKDHEYYLKEDGLDIYLLLNSRNRYSSLDDYVEVLHWGYTYSFLRNLDNALICINHILEFYPNNPNYLYDKAMIFNKLKKYDETLLLIEKVRRIDKSIVNDEWYNKLLQIGKNDLFKNLLYNARDAVFKEDFESALSYYNQALIFEPHNIYILNKKAHALLYLGEYIEAIKIFDEVLEIDFDYIDALLGKSQALYYSENYKESLKCFNKTIEIVDSLIDYEFYNELFEKAEKNNRNN